MSWYINGIMVIIIKSMDRLTKSTVKRWIQTNDNQEGDTISYLIIASYILLELKEYNFVLQ